MKRLCKKLAVLIAALTMTMDGQAKTQDLGGMVINEKGEPIAHSRSRACDDETSCNNSRFFLKRFC